jgi:hypothetical protein
MYMYGNPGRHVGNFGEISGEFRDGKIARKDTKLA